MKKVLIWISLGLMFLGIVLFCCVGVSLNFDFRRLDDMTYITNTYEFNKQISSIVLNTVTAQIDFQPSENGKCSVVCYEPENIRYDVSVTDGVLLISMTESDYWKDHIRIFNFHTPVITIYLPEGVYQSLKVTNTTGDINVCGDWIFSDMSLKTTTGDICVDGVTCYSDVSIHVTTGDLKLTNVATNNLIAEGNSGDVELKYVTASSSMRIKRVTGDIKLHQCDGQNIFIKTTTGDVTGILRSAKQFTVRTTTGDVEVPDFDYGGVCDIETTTGDISVKVN